MIAIFSLIGFVNELILFHPLVLLITFASMVGFYQFQDKKSLNWAFAMHLIGQLIGATGVAALNNLQTSVNVENGVGKNSKMKLGLSLLVATNL